MFVASGTLALLYNHLPGGPARIALDLVATGNVVAAAVVRRVSWSRWSRQLTLAFLPFALAMIAAANRFGGVPPQVYGIFYVTVFLWLGLHERPWSSVVLSPLAAAAYLAPQVGRAHPDLDAIRSVAITIPVCVLIGEVLSRTVNEMRSARRAEQRSAAALVRAAVTDDLTGLGNRRRGDDLLAGLVPGDELLLLDLDRFKQVNDTFGHAEGDRLLAQLGGYLRGQLGDEVVARYGGEEFLVAIHGPPGAGEETAQRLMRGWRLLAPVITFSIGVAVHTADHSAAKTFGEADAALYEAKRGGRDQVRVHGQIQPRRPHLRAVAGAGRG